MPNVESVVTVYETHLEAEAAVKELQTAGIDMRTLSIVGKDYHTEEQVVGYYNTGDRMKRWGKTGAFWGLLFGSAFFAIPGLGTAAEVAKAKDVLETTRHAHLALHKQEELVAAL